MIKITLDENQSSSNHDEKNDVSKIDQEVKITLYDDVVMCIVMCCVMCVIMSVMLVVVSKRVVILVC